LLLGRTRECGQLNELLDVVRRGESQILVLRGEPGIGKTALLDYAVASARGFNEIRATGSESESALPFAALHQVCTPILDKLDRLPEPQQDALRITFGVTTGDVPDRLLIGLATSSLFSEASAEQHLLCVIDNEHLLDQPSAQALAFVARRLRTDPVAMIFATTAASPELEGLPELALTGLRDDDARALLACALRAPLDEQVLERVVAETQGNPRTLLDLPKAMSPAELAGGFGVPTASGLSTNTEKGFRGQFDALPPDSQLLSLVAAAESTGDAITVWRAAERMGIPREASAPAASAGLVEIGARVQFRHPLARLAAYRTAPVEERLRVHQALAEVINPEADPARHVWHRALGVAGPDDVTADALERSAPLAQAKGGIAASAAFLAKAVELTTDLNRRGKRALAAAAAQLEAGDPDTAVAMLRVAETATLGELDRARADLVRGRLALVMNRGRDAPTLLLRTAQRFSRLDLTMTRHTLLDAFVAALFAGRLAGDDVLQRIAETARLTKPCASSPTSFDRLLDGLALLITEGHKAAAPELQQALRELRSEDITDPPRLRWLWLASRVAMELWDDESWDVLSARQIRLSRQVGALSVLPMALRARVGVELSEGRLEAATVLHDEAEALTQLTRSEPLHYGAVVLAAWRGIEDIGPPVKVSMNSVEHLGDGSGLTNVEWATAVLYNAAGRYAEAIPLAERASGHPDEFGLSLWALAELIEAAARNGQPNRAADALQRLTDAAQASGSHWALGIEARSRALLTAGACAEALYTTAIDHLSRTRAHTYLARAHLIYGEWLRRHRRRIHARTQLSTAHKLFVAMGFEAFAKRSLRELKATGGNAAATGDESASDLTSREAQIARLARDGLSNTEIGGRLFISPRTVEYHLRKIYTKLAISSRTELPQVI
jgi:DNA-binding CsgD family transcriptional regulator/tetratricopeptide (TPR) repeat protein